MQTVGVKRHRGFVAFEPLANRSLEAYKAYVRGIGYAITGKVPIADMSENDWRKSWELYWAQVDAPVYGDGGVYVQ